jgi:hypothetical protein
MEVRLQCCLLATLTKEGTGKMESTATKITALISELTRDLEAVERQEKLQIITADDAKSVRKSIEQSIADLRKIPCD